jgi:hypothetical protein
VLIVEFADLKIGSAAESYRTSMAEYLPKPLRTLYRSGRANAVNGLTSSNVAAIVEIKRQCHEMSDFRHTFALFCALGGYRLNQREASRFLRWVRPISAYGLIAAEVGSNAHAVERTHRDVRVDGADHYVVLFQLAGRSAMTYNEEAVRFGVGDVVFVDVGRPTTFFAGNAGESWSTMALFLPRQALVSHLGFEPRGELYRRNGTFVGRLLLDLIRNAGEGEVPPSRTECYMRLAVYDLVGALFAPSDPAPARHSDKLFMRVQRHQGRLRRSESRPF